MMTTFESNFWGDKFNGFEVLHHNYKMGANGTKEFGEFIKERSGAEEAYSKALLKLSNKTSSHGHIGSFEPCWKFVQNSTEKIANIHVRVIQIMQEVAKMLRDYGDIQKDKQKQLKDEFGTMSEAVQNINNLSASVQKAKEYYQQRTAEVDRCRKESTTVKEIEKSESKLKKSCEYYKTTIEKRETARKDYEKRMRVIAQKFQELEKDHLASLLKILNKYGDSLLTERSLLDQIIEEFKKNMSVLSVDSLLMQFISSKGTGTQIPEPIQFEEITLTSPPVEADVIASRQGDKKKTKRVKKKLKHKDKTPATNGNVQNDSPSVPEIELEVDSEGYRIPPPDTESLRSGVSKGSFSSDSDSDSDDEPRKFKVTIKPKESTSNSPSLSMDELKTLSANLTLSSPSTASKRHSSTQDDGFFSGSGNLARTSSNLSRSSNALFDLNTSSKESSPIPPARSRKLFPTSTSMDALGEAAVAAAIKSPAPKDNEKKLVTFGDLFDTPSSDTTAGTTQSSTVPVNKDATAPIPIENQQRKTSKDVAPPPLPVKKRSMSGNSQSSLGFNPEATAKEQSSAPKVVSSSQLSTAIATQRPKTSISTSQFPALAPPLQTTSRRHAISKKERPLPQPPSRKASQAEMNNDQPEQAPVAGSFLADLADINFGAAQTTNFFPSTAVDQKEKTQSTSVPSTMSLDSSTTVTTPVPVPRGDLQASKPEALTSNSPAVPMVEKVTPIAVAFIETINSQFKGADLSKCDVRITGDMAISFPASIIPLLTTDPSPPPVLAFDIVGTNALEQIVPNLALVERCSQTAGGDTITFKFNMAALSSYLKKQAEQGRSASYYNIDIIKYHVRANGQASTPLQLGAFWKCDSAVTDLKIDFKYNATALQSVVPLTGISMVVPVSGGVTAMQSKPTATWSAEHMRALWKMPSMSHDTGNNGVGSFRARFDVSSGPSVPAAIGVQFAGEGAIISNLKFDLKSSWYKLSLVKRRFITGKYTVEP